MTTPTDTDVPEFDTLTLAIDAGVATIALNRGDKANALNATMWQEIEDAFKWADQDSRVRAVVLHGEGKHFCAGIDLGFFAELDKELESLEAARRSEQLRRKILQLQGNLTAIERCRKPVLAAVHSACLGAGLDMISCCDMRYCSEDSYFSIKEIDLGMTADVGSLQRLPKLIGDGMLRELAYTGRQIDAPEAKALGLVNQVFANKSALLQSTLAIARQIAEKSPLAIRGTKEMLIYARDHSVQDSLNHVATWNAGMLSNADLMQAIIAASQGQKVNFDD